jgi:uncharacterized protein (TIGR02118 family)
MFVVHIWMRKKEGMSSDEFLDYWLNSHAPIARDGYTGLKGYAVKAVTRAPEGAEVPYDGVAELWWDDRDAFRTDMKSDVATASTEDLANFTSAFGLLFVDQRSVK